MIKWMRKKLWHYHYKDCYVSFAQKQHPAISYVILCDIEFSGEKLFIKLGYKEYERYLITKMAKLHSQLIHEHK